MNISNAYLMHNVMNIDYRYVFFTSVHWTCVLLQVSSQPPLSSNTK